MRPQGVLRILRQIVALASSAEDFALALYASAPYERGTMMEIIMADKPEDKDQQDFKRGMEELAAMSDEERRKDARWILLNAKLIPSGSSFCCVINGSDAASSPQGGKE